MSNRNSLSLYHCLFLIHENGRQDRSRLAKAVVAHTPLKYNINILTSNFDYYEFKKVPSFICISRTFLFVRITAARQAAREENGRLTNI